MAIIIFKYFPLFALLFATIPALIKPKWYKSVPGYNQENAANFKRAYWGSFIYMIIIWTPMVLGIFFGNVPTMVHYFQRGSGNFFINFYWIIIALLSVLSFVWIFFMNGDNFLVNYYFPMQSSRRPGKRRSSISPSMIKLFSIINLIGVSVLWFFVIPDDVSVLNDLLSGIQ